MKNFAMLGKWHVHAEGYANMINALPDCRISKVWDPDCDTAKEWAKKLNCEAASLEDILQDAAVEGVLLCSATNEHPDLLLKACKAGKAIFTEKVLTISPDDAEEVRKAVLENHIRFTISFPHFSLPTIQFAFDMARSGKLGDINYARLRNVHGGSIAGWLPPHFYDPVACGGGAMMDLGAHPMYLLSELLGMPKSIHSSFTKCTGKAVEDNAVSLLEYENGAIGVSETGFVSTDYPYMFEIGGTKGTLLVRGDELTYACEETNHQWTKPEKMPEKKPEPLEQWALADKPEDISPLFNIDAAVRLTRIMAMAYGK